MTVMTKVSQPCEESGRRDAPSGPSAQEPRHSIPIGGGEFLTSARGACPSPPREGLCPSRLESSQAAVLLFSLISAQ